MRKQLPAVLKVKSETRTSAASRGHKKFFGHQRIESASHLKRLNREHFPSSNFLHPQIAEEIINPEFMKDGTLESTCAPGWYSASLSMDESSLDILVVSSIVKEPPGVRSLKLRLYVSEVVPVEPMEGEQLGFVWNGDI